VSLIVWVGGMVFAHFFLRPSLGGLEPALRLTLMHEILGRFFKAVLICAILAFLTGMGMMGYVGQAAASGGMHSMPVTWLVMAVLGVLMVGIFGHIRFALYERLSAAVASQSWQTGGEALAAIRRWVVINLTIGFAIVLVVRLG